MHKNAANAGGPLSYAVLQEQKSKIMEIADIKTWVKQANVCRCCLTQTGTLDLTSTFRDGLKEVLSDTLQQCYGIALSHLNDWGASRLACTSCVDLLRLAEAFRKQVLESERLFTEYWKGIVPVKIEDEDHINDFGDSPNIHDDIRPHAEGDPDQSNFCNIFERPKTQSLRTRQGRRKSVKTKRNREKIADENECDSDTPIAQLSSKNVISATETLDGKNHSLCSKELVENSLNCSDFQTVHIDFDGQQPPPEVKQISERKRVIQTCAIVLKDTTACPFRHHKSWFQCFFCQQDFMEINLLRNHISQTHPNVDEELNKIKRYPRSLQIDISHLKCRHCDVPLTDIDAMTQHFQSVHYKTVYKECIADYKVDASPYSCHICKRVFHVFRTLTTHLNEHYANCICDVCGKSFLNSKRLKVHKRTHESGTYPCNKCGKVLKTKTSKANHMESAHSKRVMKCQICFEPMKHYNDRIKHMSQVHNITHKFKCSICSREYNIKHYLATHMRQTHGHKNKKCLECGMAFITNHGLKKHMLRHSGEKPFTCAICSKSYVRSYTLKEHMRVHGTEKRTAPSDSL